MLGIILMVTFSLSGTKLAPISGYASVISRMTTTRAHSKMMHVTSSILLVQHQSEKAGVFLRTIVTLLCSANS